MNAEIKNYESFLTYNTDIDKDFFFKKIDDLDTNSYLSLMYAYFLIKKDEISEAETVLDRINLNHGIPYLQSLYFMNEGLIAMSKGDTQMSESKLRASYEADSGKYNKWIRLELFRYYTDKVDYEAWKYLESALDLDPEFNQAKVEKSYQLDEDLNCDEVIDLLKDIPESYKDSDAMNLFGVALINCGRFDQAKEALKKSITIKPSSNNCFSLAQLMHEKYEDYEEAESLYKKSLDLDKSNLDAINGFAWLNYDMNEMARAESQILSLLEFTQDQEIYNQIVNFYFLTDRPDNANKYINEAQKVHGKNSINEGYKIIEQIYRKENYEPLINEYKSNYSEEEIEWLKNQIVFFFGEE
ncbi:tetratricopeptide repeat protein [Flavobacteriaceae bacterium 3-367]